MKPEDLLQPQAGQMQVGVVEKRTFVEYGWDVGPEQPGAGGLPMRELLFVTKTGTLFAFPMNAIGLAELRRKIDRLHSNGE